MKHLFDKFLLAFENYNGNDIKKDIKNSKLNYLEKFEAKD